MGGRLSRRRSRRNECQTKERPTTPEIPHTVDELRDAVIDLRDTVKEVLGRLDSHDSQLDEVHDIIARIKVASAAVTAACTTTDEQQRFN